jgi:hypothetical protein
VSKKIKKPIKPRKPEKKNNRKNQTEKKLIKPIKILKKPAGLVRFRFYRQKTKKTNRNPKKPEKTEPKPSQTKKTEPNRFEPVFSLKNRTKSKPVGLTRFQFGFVFLKKISVWLLFLIKTEPN